MEIQERDGMIYGLVDGKQVSYIEYRTIGYRTKSIFILKVYTMEDERGHGYASQLLEYLINTYGNKSDIELSCRPYDISFANDEFGEKYKKLQDDTAKWYEKFGFVTFNKEEYESSYKWMMKRKKNNIIK